uniref:Uncharacterized protein n=1 Tax=Rhizophagus irregularis (strain DAOM 181602 / DAOM 197198 / MUCL 43194) TaxID=747089 RepID=U9SMS6_RHIID
MQDAHDLLTLHLSEKFQAWVKNLPIIVEDINNSITRLIDLSPAMAIKKKQVISQSSKTREGPMGYDEPRLTYDVLIRYLLEPGELEGDSKRRATDKNWSPQVYHIKKLLVQKNQPVLYWLINNEGNSPERSFVREELLVIPHDTELPPQWVLTS